jgi:hypothetical protein
MKTTKLISLAITAFVGLASTVWAGPYSGGGSGHFGGGGFGGGHVGGGFAGGHVSNLNAGHFSGARVGSFNGGGIRAAPTFSGSPARFSGNRSIVTLNRTPQQFSYYTGAGAPAVMSHTSARRLPNRSMGSNAGRIASLNRQSSQANSAVGQRRLPGTRLSAAQNRQSFMKNHAFARHDGSWHRDWDRHRAHFDHGHVFVFVDGSWWGLYPWDYYPDYGYGSYPYDYTDDYEGYHYGSYDYNSSSPYGYYNGYAPSGEYSSTVVSAVQSKLASLGYYHGAIDGILGDESEAALARYQQDQDVSVTGTVTPATLQALDLPYSSL